MQTSVTTQLCVSSASQHMSRRHCSANPNNARSAQLVVRAQRQAPFQEVAKAAGKGLLSIGVALSLALGAVQPAAAQSLAEKRAAAKASLEESLARMEYAFEQQQIAAKAEAISKVQVVEKQAAAIENALEKKIVEEQARKLASPSNEAVAAKEEAQLNAAVAQVQQRVEEAKALIQQRETAEEADLLAKKAAAEAKNKEQEDSLNAALNSFVSSL